MKIFRIISANEFASALLTMHMRKGVDFCPPFETRKTDGYKMIARVEARHFEMFSEEELQKLNQY